MDELSDSVLEFCDLLKAPIALVKFVKIGVQSISVIPPAVDKTLGNPEPVAYIKNRGRDDAQQLREYLKPCVQPLSKIHSLLFKGQVFGFKNYQECQNACTMITKQYGSSSSKKPSEQSHCGEAN